MPAFESVTSATRRLSDRCQHGLNPRLVLSLSCPSQLLSSAIVPLCRVTSLGSTQRQKSPLVLRGRVGMIPLKRDVTDRDGDSSHLDSAPLPPPTHPTPSLPPNNSRPTEHPRRRWHPKLPTRECASAHPTTPSDSC